MQNAILIINAGSSSLKFAGYVEGGAPEPALLGKGQIEGIGTAPSFKVQNEGGVVTGEHRALETVVSIDNRVIEDVGRELLHDRKHIFAFYERHLHIQLRELRLPVGTQVFVTEALGELVVTVESSDHQQLLEQLR